MIIDGSLVVSKKKKAVLVAELRKLKFRPFPKVAEARKEGETAQVVENADEEDNNDDAELKSAVSDYDYLLGVCISRFVPAIITANQALDGNLVPYPRACR